ncbi:hypothetical protein DFP94_1011232 [Fontibacillus phaseoli]|uniref:Uncharacterized protein n=1 Tax=Fontibacillus phaseoli TaxID=1416533 RepID=A0A369BPT2_9BACL|nr:hypothetical protein [Fontibacillus phaseoli]RCX23630.1 hypothetical protein DFP94_1011232 [Fontibacillus phaseoli]
MFRKRRMGYWGIIALLLLTMNLSACTSNESIGNAESGKQKNQQNQNQSESDLERLTKLMQTHIDKNLKYRGKESVKGSSDEMLVFYADVPEGTDAVRYHLNARTGTVVDAVSGSPLINVLVKSPNLNDLNGEAYVSALEELVTPLILEKGYKLDGKLDDSFVGFQGDGTMEYEVTKPGGLVPALCLIHVEPFTKEVTEEGEIKASDEVADAVSVETAEMTNYAMQDADATLEQLADRGYQMIEDQSFETELQPWGKITFVSGYYNENGVKQSVYHILNSDQTVTYTLPVVDTGNDTFAGINAIAFKDMNADGKKDIQILSDYESAESGVHTSRAAVYFSTWEYYTVLPWYNDLLDDSGHNDTIINLVKEGRRIQGQISPNSDNTEIEKEIEALASLICNEKFLHTGDLDYAALGESLLIFSQNSAADEITLAGLAGQHFADYRKDTLSGKKSLAGQVRQYEKLLSQILEDAEMFNGIKYEGGSMWNTFNAYKGLDLQIELNRYVSNETLKTDEEYDTYSWLQSEWKDFKKELQTAAKNKVIGNDDYSVDLSDDQAEQIKTMEKRLTTNMNELLKLMADDPGSTRLMQLVRDTFYTEM